MTLKSSASKIYAWHHLFAICKADEGRGQCPDLKIDVKPMDSEYQNWYQIRFGKLDENLQHVENCCLYFFAVEQIKTLHQTWMTYVNFIHYFTPWKNKFEFTWMLRWIFLCWETLLTIFQFEMATIVFRSYISLCGQLSPFFSLIFRHLLLCRFLSHL